MARKKLHIFWCSRNCRSGSSKTRPRPALDPQTKVGPRKLDPDYTSLKQLSHDLAGCSPPQVGVLNIVGFLITACLLCTYSHLATLTPTHHPSDNLSAAILRTTVAEDSVTASNECGSSELRQSRSGKTVKLFQGFECLNLSLTSHPPHQPNDYSVSYGRLGLCHHGRMLIQTPRKHRLVGVLYLLPLAFVVLVGSADTDPACRVPPRSEAARTQFFFFFIVILFPL